MHKPLTAPLLASLLMTLACAGAHAQGVYRIVGPDGKVTFSDRPPAEGNAQPARMTGTAPASANDNLPTSLRQVAGRFPVTLYTGNDCTPCTSARTFLTSRGIPFTERTVTSNEDIAALQKLSNNTSLPFGTIGNQHLIGFSEGEWSQYLDTAGYPQQSQLPRNYRAPTPTPLVAVKAAEPAASPASASAPPAATNSRVRPPAPVNEGPSPSNPAGIRF
ncbi:glutaredoxin family protein [Acidovorax sp. LjRoot117]|uniref:glutaredoxin family protein n=1 Tax=Acidovorax sp. LjRoot117 TaxID=3342255 RepID=UPI003ECF071A